MPGPRIVVVGGGIGGLACAAFLRRAGLTATVYEQASALTEVGAGLVTAPNAVRLLRRLGIMDQFLSRAVPLDWGWELHRRVLERDRDDRGVPHRVRRLGSAGDRLDRGRWCPRALGAA